PAGALPARCGARPARRPPPAPRRAPAPTTPPPLLPAAAGTRSGCAAERRPPRPPRMALTRSGARCSAASWAVSPFPGASTPGSVLAEPKGYTAFTRLHTLRAYLPGGPADDYARLE